ncbi:MAG TPA: ATP-binding protein, partial [Thiotrichales bacterium]|nr:ATP-binding protein [Thiotrichales bacterium]
EIAAAGGHSLLLVGPPGSGKSMLATRMAGILPPLSEAQRLQSAAIHSLASLPVEPILAGQLPYQSPHHSASAVALVGGGSKPRPGAISIASHGILFLDELPEFDRRTLEM